MVGSNGWLETEWQEGIAHESGIPDIGSDGIRRQSLHSSKEVRLTADGAKGDREVDE